MLGAVIGLSRLNTNTCSKCGSRVFLQIFRQRNLQGTYSSFQQLKVGVRNFSNSRTFFQNGSWRNINGIFRKNNGHQQILSVRPNIFQHLKRNVTQKPEAKPLGNPLKINTNITNNVMLYRYERPWMYKIAFGFGIVALVGCLAMVDNVYLILCKDLFRGDVPMLENIKNHILPLSFITIGIIGGPLILISICYVISHTVKYIVLHKGGKVITLVTYHPIKGETKMKIPVERVSSQASRTAAGTYLPLRMKNKRFKYIVDKQGNFVNPELFDATVGAERF